FAAVVPLDAPGAPPVCNLLHHRRDGGGRRASRSLQDGEEGSGRRSRSSRAPAGPASLRGLRAPTGGRRVSRGANAELPVAGDVGAPVRNSGEVHGFAE